MESEENGEGGRCFGGVEEIPGPREFHQHRPNRGEKKQVIPAFAQHDRADADVEQRDVTEQSERMVLSGRKQNRRQKSAEQTEDDDNLRVEHDGEEKCRDRDARHERERRRERNQIVESFRGKDVGVENEDAGGAKALSRDAIIFLAARQPAAIKPNPMITPIAMRMRGVMRLFSKEYFTRKTTPRKKTKPPIHAKSFTPMKASQSMAARTGDGGGTAGPGLVRPGAGAGAGFGANTGSGGGIARVTGGVGAG